jgi:hypothetical protein
MSLLVLKLKITVFQSVIFGIRQSNNPSFSTSKLPQGKQEFTKTIAMFGVLLVVWKLQVTRK